MSSKVDMLKEALEPFKGLDLPPGALNRLLVAGHMVHRQGSGLIFSESELIIAEELLPQRSDKPMTNVNVGQLKVGENVFDAITQVYEALVDNGYSEIAKKWNETIAGFGGIKTIRYIAKQFVIVEDED